MAFLMPKHVPWAKYVSLDFMGGFALCHSESIAAAFGLGSD
jgi:hypothetical protein